MSMYGAFARAAFMTQLEYRGQYLLRMVSKLTGWSVGFLSVMILLMRFSDIGGWNRYEVLLLYSFDVLSYAIAATFFMGSFQKLPRLIRQGELDLVLTKPVNPMVYLICTKVSAGYTTNYAIGTAMIVLCFRRLHLAVTPGRVCWLIIDLLGAALIQAAAFVITAVPSFWLLKCEGLYYLFFKNVTDFLQYPLTIYHRGVQLFLTFILPYGFINFYPVQVFLDREEGCLAAGFRYMTPVVGAALFFLAYSFWLAGLRAYQSTGS